MPVRILVAGGEQAMTASLGELCRREGYLVDVAASVPDALQRVTRDPCDAALVDCDLPSGDALALVKRLLAFDFHPAVIVMVWEHQTAIAAEAARLGAYDFVTKPFDSDKIPIRLQVALEKRKPHIEARLLQEALVERVNQRTRELWDKKEKIRNQFLNTIKSLLSALQAKHPYTEGHSRRVAELSRMLATELGLAERERKDIELAALFHDIGKIGIKDQVLNKEGSLTADEYEHIKLHPLIAEQILGGIEELSSILLSVKHEHERYDGRGYPSMLRGEAIPLGARIIAIADAYDSLTTDRSYRKGCSWELAVREIERCSGTQFDPELTQLFTQAVGKRFANKEAPAGILG